MQNTTRRHPSPLLALALGVLTGLPVAAAAGAPTAAVPRVTVRVGDLDLESRAGIAALYQRLSRASRAVCASLDGRTLRERQAYEQCRRDSIERAVHDVGNSDLLALHGARTARRTAG
jgi:UrcA family protein